MCLVILSFPISISAVFCRELRFPGVEPQENILKSLHYDMLSKPKASAYNVGDLGSIPGLRRSPGEGNGNPLQYSCLENAMDREAW